MSGAKHPEKKFFVVHLQFFDSTSTISRLGERFRDWQYSLDSFLFSALLLTVPLPRCPAICNIGGHTPVPYGVCTTAHSRTQSITAICPVPNMLHAHAMLTEANKHIAM